MASQSLTLKQIAKLISAELIGDPAHVITDVADLAGATSTDISFLAHPRYQQAMLRTEAGAVLVTNSLQLPQGRNFLLVADPSLAFQTLINHFYNKNSLSTGFQGIHATALIHPSVKWGRNVAIGPYAVIDQGVSIGDDTIISAHVSIGPSTVIGSQCLIHPHVTIREGSILGNRVVLQPGCVIGSCGFGYNTTKEGRHIKLEQVGCVLIEDDVEIGANTTIDRARFKRTRIAQGTKIDNQVQIGHSVQLGQDNMIVSQVGIAGSTQTEQGVVLGGQVGVLGHIKLGKNVRVAACSGVSKSLETGDYGGIPAVPLQEYNRNAVYLRNMERYIKKLEKKIAALEEQLQAVQNPRA